MKLSYIPDPPPTTSTEEQGIIERIRERRIPRPLTPLDRTLLHSPHVADGWNSFLGAIRTKTSLSQDLRELSICRVAAINRAWYEWVHHAPLAIAAGISDAALDIVKQDNALNWENRRDVFTEKQLALLTVTEEMTSKVQVSERTLIWLKKLFSEREIVEIVAIIACYNCVSHFLVCLNGKCRSRSRQRRE